LWLRLHELEPEDMVRDVIECENARGGAGVQKAEDRSSGLNVPRELAFGQDA
jgi:hypothetical protein